MRRLPVRWAATTLFVTVADAILYEISDMAWDYTGSLQVNKELLNFLQEMKAFKTRNKIFIWSLRLVISRVCP